MKNKSKLKKIKENRQGAKAAVKNWLYLSQEKISVADIAAALEAFEGIQVELWVEAKVLEIEVPEKRSMDIEEIPVDLKDEYSNAFLEEQKAKSLFAVTIDTDNYDFMKKIMRHAIEKLGGMFCGDTDNFEPTVK